MKHLFTFSFLFLVNLLIGQALMTENPTSESPDGGVPDFVNITFDPLSNSIVATNHGSPKTIKFGFLTYKRILMIKQFSSNINLVTSQPFIIYDTPNLSLGLYSITVFYFKDSEPNQILKTSCSFIIQ